MYSRLYRVFRKYLTHLFSFVFLIYLIIIGSTEKCCYQIEEDVYNICCDKATSSYISP
jgi:hypothetical protein